MAAATPSALPRLGAVTPRSIGILALAAALMTAGLVTYGSWVRVSGIGSGLPRLAALPGRHHPRRYGGGHRVRAPRLRGVHHARGLRRRRPRLPAPRRDGRAGPLSPVAAAALILIQAIIGGVAVLAELPQFIIMVHLTMAMTILALLTASGLRILTRNGGASAFDLPARAAVLVAAGAIMVGGSTVATQTGPGCLNIPFCAADSTTMATWLHTFHRALGIVLFITAVVVAFAVRRSGGPPLAAGLSAALVVLVVAQGAAGIVAVVTTFPDSLRILHVGFATLIWASLIGLWALAAPAEAEIHPSRRGDSRNALLPSGLSPLMGETKRVRAARRVGRGSSL